MKLAHHYRTLGLGRSASFTEVKVAYRQLVRKYHPDLNPDEQAATQFIAINEAYTALSDALSKAHRNKSSRIELHETAPFESTKAKDGAAFREQAAAAEPLDLDELRQTLERLGIGDFQKSQRKARSVGRKKRSVEDYKQKPPSARADNVSVVDSSGVPISEADRLLKRDAYTQLKVLLGQQKFPRAIALVEGLSNRLPTDLEISQWKAIVYQRWGRQLINEGQLRKAKIYLKKATRVDPNNSTLGAEIERDLARLAILRSI
ncbi:DnaJ domain-containing protein [cf. Phormidesmis sp. LEGE 11477]|uniref:DnaJ domain-containing protein n=1 Tax=cf. Phormidesmis sp. LEGE 11477 TaxID=1828680 RepID=UPI001D13FA03|nr:DnaJ domain-containing protein [cf. Phormidesmis sp. LEGE 11477]